MPYAQLTSHAIEARALGSNIIIGTCPLHTTYMRRILQTMAVPKMTQLHSGTGVNIVLKTDQSSGKLTTGHVADILTRGDHPRGIKVRLTNGQIGRVQSLFNPTNSAHQDSSTAPQPSSSYDTVGTPQKQDLNATVAPRGGRWGMAQDVREDGHDPESRPESSSLFDYVRPPKQRKVATKPQPERSEGHDALQGRLEAEFPKLDPALIAAMLADYPAVDEVRGVLKGLS